MRNVDVDVRPDEHPADCRYPREPTPSFVAWLDPFFCTLRRGNQYRVLLALGECIGRVCMVGGSVLARLAHAQRDVSVPDAAAVEICDSTSRLGDVDETDKRHADGHSRCVPSDLD